MTPKQIKISEKAVRKKIELSIGGNGKTTIFANPTGIGVVGKISKFTPGETATVFNARYQAFGLGSKPNDKDSGGFPDLIGWHSVRITPKMVGLDLAVFVGLELKKPGKKPSKLQQRRIDLINRSGGLAGCATSVEEAEEILNMIDVRAELNEK